MVFREWFWPLESYYWQMGPTVVCACPWKGNTMRSEAEVNRAIDQYPDMVLRLCMVKRKRSRKLWEVRLLENKIREALEPLHADQALKRKAKANICSKTFDYGCNLYQLRRHRHGRRRHRGPRRADAGQDGLPCLCHCRYDMVYCCQTDAATVRAAQEAGLSVAWYLAWQQLKQLDPAASPEDALALEISEVRALAGFRNANFPCQQERKED